MFKTFSIRNKSIRALAGDPYFYDQWKKIEQGELEPFTYKVFDEYIDKDTVYYDLGAYIGTTCLYAAQNAKQAFAFEPDPVAFEMLKSNTEANPQIDNLKIHPYAIGAKEGTVKISST